MCCRAKMRSDTAWRRFCPWASSHSQHVHATWPPMTQPSTIPARAGGPWARIGLAMMVWNAPSTPGRPGTPPRSTFAPWHLHIHSREIALESRDGSLHLLRYSVCAELRVYRRSWAPSMRTSQAAHDGMPPVARSRSACEREPAACAPSPTAPVLNRTPVGT